MMPSDLLVIWNQTTELKWFPGHSHLSLDILKLYIKPVDLLHLIKDERVLTVCNLLADFKFYKRPLF